MASLQALYPRIARQVRRPLGTFGRIGDHTIFYGRAIAGTPHAALHFRKAVSYTHLTLPTILRV